MTQAPKDESAPPAGLSDEDLELVDGGGLEFPQGGNGGNGGAGGLLGGTGGAGGQGGVG